MRASPACSTSPPTGASMPLRIRGNSGSGKSTPATALRMASARKIAIVEQDYLRRFVLKEKDRVGGDNTALIEQVTEFSLASPPRYAQRIVTDAT